MHTILTFVGEVGLAFVALHLLAWGVDLAIRR
jgi:hypothetical protein